MVRTVLILVLLAGCSKEHDRLVYITDGCTAWREDTKDVQYGMSSDGHYWKSWSFEITCEAKLTPGEYHIKQAD